MELFKSFDESLHPRGENGRFTSKGYKKKFSDMTDDEKRQKKEQIESNIVASIPENSVPYNWDGAYDKAAQEWLKNNLQGNADTEIGEIIINVKSGIRDMHHGDDQDKYLKLQTLPAVKEVLEKGTYLGYERDFDGKNISNHYFAGKIRYGNDEKIIFCRVRENAGDAKRFYVHEVFTGKELKKASMRTSSPSLLRLIGKPLYKYILQDILNVKGKALQKALKNQILLKCNILMTEYAKMSKESMHWLISMGNKPQDMDRLDYEIVKARFYNALNREFVKLVREKEGRNAEKEMKI